MINNKEAVSNIFTTAMGKDITLIVSVLITGSILIEILYEGVTEIITINSKRNVVTYLENHKLTSKPKVLSEQNNKERVLEKGFFTGRKLDNCNRFILSETNASGELRRAYMMKLDYMDGDFENRVLVLNDNEFGKLNLVEVIDPDGHEIGSYIDYLGDRSRHRVTLNYISTVEGF